MNHHKLVRLSNLVGLAVIVLLIYWVFTFVSIETFGFRIFRKNMSEFFVMSVLGILALMAGALMVNIMMNLTIIAGQRDAGVIGDQKSRTRYRLVFLLSFPLIFGLLYVGDRLTSLKKERMLVSSAEAIIREHDREVEALLNYSFDEAWIRESAETMKFLSGIDKNFPYVQVVVRDSINQSPVFLGFIFSHYRNARSEPLRKTDYLFQTTLTDRAYLQRVLDSRESGYRFSASDGRYELYYPVRKNGRVIVLYFSEYQAYGKIGS